MASKHIIAFRLSSLGDVAMCVPVVISALEQNPDLKIDFVAPKFMHCFFPKHERLTLIDFDKKREFKGLLGIYKFFKTLDANKYTAFADLHNVLRAKALNLLFKTKGIKTTTLNKGRKEKKNLINHSDFKQLKHTTERYADVFRQLNFNLELNHQLTDFHKFNLNKTNAIGFAPFAAHQGKMYDINSMKIVVNEIQKFVPVKIFGSKNELNQIIDWEEMDNVSLVRENSIYDEIKLISSLQLMISMDSANMHLASLVGVPVISIWGVTHPYAGFLGYGQKYENVIQDDTLSWRPTSIFGNKLGDNSNPNGMMNIKPQQIIDKIKSTINL